MSVYERFMPGDFLIFQIESGYGLLRILGVSSRNELPVWHVRAFSDLFLDFEFAESAARTPEFLTVAITHEAITNRAFESTQMAFIMNVPVTPVEIAIVESWIKRSDVEPTDRSVRLLLGLR